MAVADHKVVSSPKRRDAVSSPPAVTVEDAEQEMDIYSLLYENSDEELDELASQYSDVQSRYDDEEDDSERIEDTDADEEGGLESDADTAACEADSDADDKPETAARLSAAQNKEESDGLSETSGVGASSKIGPNTDGPDDENFDGARILELAIAGDTRGALEACPISQQPLRVVGTFAVAAELAKWRTTPLKHGRVDRPKEATICRLRIKLENGAFKHSPQPCHRTFLVGKNSKSGDTFIRHLGRAHFKR